MNNLLNHHRPSMVDLTATPLYLIQKLHHLDESIEVSSDFIGKINQAEEICISYPHIDKEVVLITLLLAELLKEGHFTGGLQQILNSLSDINLEQRFKIIQVFVEAQSSFTTGEARIVQYFYH